MIISWNTTKKCNLSCKHCYRESGPDVTSTSELDTAQGKRLIDQIKESGFKILILSGGEPLLREDIFELASYADSNGLRPALGSNGMMISSKIAEKIVSSGISVVSISLDSATEKYHDDFRNSSGSWQKAVKGIKNSIDAGLKVQINTTLTENNFEQFEDVVDLATNLGVGSVHPFFLVPTGRGVHIEQESLKRDKYFQMIKMVMKMQGDSDLELKPTCAPQFVPISKDMGIETRFTRGCIAGIRYCCILPNGDVHICPYLPVKTGNVIDKPFNRIWHESEVFIKLRNFREYEGQCGSCNNLNICGGCRARAYYYNEGNYMSEDPWCNGGGR
ncbi:radical SAM protein [Methanobacterium sp.]|uniref:radical SAM protein n=1 Tax=Methanobacterium sp. TaxID=2164 RepID=UPI003C75ADFD